MSNGIEILGEKINDRVTIVNHGNWIFWVRVVGANKHITGREYSDVEECVKDALELDMEYNKDEYINQKQK